MKVVVLGCGRVGRAMVMDLASERGWEITAVDALDVDQRVHQDALDDRAGTAVLTVRLDVTVAADAGTEERVWLGLEWIVDRTETGLDAAAGITGFDGRHRCQVAEVDRVVAHRGDQVGRQHALALEITAGSHISRVTLKDFGVFSHAHGSTD